MEAKRKVSPAGPGPEDPSQWKRPRGGDWEDENPSQFEEALAYLDEVESEMTLEMESSSQLLDVMAIGEATPSGLPQGLMPGPWLRGCGVVDCWLMGQGLRGAAPGGRRRRDWGSDIEL